MIIPGQDKHPDFPWIFLVNLVSEGVQPEYCVTTHCKPDLIKITINYTMSYDNQGYYCILYGKVQYLLILIYHSTPLPLAPFLPLHSLPPPSLVNLIIYLESVNILTLSKQA